MMTDLSEFCSPWWGYRQIPYSPGHPILTPLLIPLTLFVCILTLLQWRPSLTRTGYGISLVDFGLMGSCTSLETIQLLLTQVTDMASCRIHSLDHQEMLIELPLDASMGKLCWDILSIDQWMGMGYKVDCNILDQDQLDTWRAKPWATASVDTKWVSPSWSCIWPW